MASYGKSVEKQVNELTIQLDNLKLYSFRNLVAVASGLGVERTRLELLPVLANFSDDPKMLSGIAEQLGNLVEQVGGSARLPCLLAPLESLVAASDSAVRSKAVQSLQTLSVLYSDSQLEEYFIPLLRRLSVHYKSTGRESACCLFSVSYSRASVTTRGELRNLFRELCQDQELHVRQAAAENLGEFGKVVELEYLNSYIIPILIQLHQIEQDWARLCTAVSSVSIAPLLSQEDRQRFILPMFRQWAANVSWQVRYILADNFIDLKKALGFAITMHDYVSAFKSLLEDSNSDVKRAAVKKLLKFCQSVDPSEQQTIIIKTIFPCLKKLLVDASEGVRSALATAIVSLCPIFGKEKTIEHLLPIFLTLMKDECDEVKLNVTSNLDSVKEVVGNKQFSTFMLFGIEQLARAKSWRVRNNVINSLPLFAKEYWLGGSRKRLKDVFARFLTDPVFANREAAISSLKKLVQELGSTWVETAIVPIIWELSHDENCKFRLTALFCINVLADVCGQHTLKQTLPIVARLADDGVANVRLNAAKTLQKIGSVVEINVSARLFPIFEALTEADDYDDDVKYFANEAINDLDLNN